jgi:hypothetical protein
MLDLSDVSATYGAVEALRGVSLSVAEGEVVALPRLFRSEQARPEEPEHLLRATLLPARHAAAPLFVGLRKESGSPAWPGSGRESVRAMNLGW